MKTTIARVYRDGRGMVELFVERRQRVAGGLLPSKGGGRALTGRMIGIVGKE
jgi:hypothetical protein